MPSPLVLFKQIRNPVDRVLHPDWLDKAIRAADDKHKQKKIKDIFSKAPEKSQASQLPLAMDIEDVAGPQTTTCPNTYIATVSKLAKGPRSGIALSTSKPLLPILPFVSRLACSRVCSCYTFRPFIFWMGGTIQTPRIWKLTYLKSPAQIERKTTKNGSAFKRQNGRSKGNGSNDGDCRPTSRIQAHPSCLVFLVPLYNT